jgi:lipopolysaccharide export system protein LptC
LRLNGETFNLDTRKHVLVSDQPVTMVHDSGEIHAEALRYDQTTGIADLKGRVTGFYHPATR